MKKVIVVLFMGVINSFIITTHLNAQFIGGKNNAGFVNSNTAAGADNKNAEKLNKAAAKSYKSFTKDFKNEKNVKWCVESNVITASFARDGIKTNVVYDKKGHLIRTAKSYNENKMDRATRTIVKSRYFDDKITQVREITEDGRKIYLVYLENNSSYKTVTVYDGEMNVYEEIRKQS